MSGEESKQKHSDPEQSIGSAPIVVNGKNKTHKSYACEKIAKYSCAAWVWIKNFGEPLTVVTLLLFGATVALYIATRDLITDTEHTAERQLRAYIGVEPIHMGKTHSGEWAFQIAMRNYGQTPARAVQVNGGWEFQLPKNGQEELEAHHFAYLRTENSSSVDVYPTKAGTAFLAPFSAEFIQRFRTYDGPMRVYGVGRITYEDIFKNLQHTDFCFILDPHDVAAGTVGTPFVASFDWCAVRYNRAS
jgi:hypothetical protein